MQRTNRYRNVKFAPEVIAEAVTRLWLGPPPDVESAEDSFSVETENGTWRHDSEAEFFADYRGSSGYFSYERTRGSRKLSVTNIAPDGTTNVSVSAESRELVQAVLELFEIGFPKSRLLPPPKPKPHIFIGHGQSNAWKELKDHLHEKHGFEIEAYEIGAREGHEIRDILEELLKNSAIALLVMTGEDATSDGRLMARQNVVHELGLFQGRLGFSKAIVLLEKDTEAFSNIAGVQQLRFTSGRIREVFGDVLAILKREFGRAV